jgi:hypothetical protein
MKAIAVALCLLLCSCATPSPWQQEQELRDLLPGTEICLLDIPAHVAAEIVRAVRVCKKKYPAAVENIQSIKTDYAMTQRSSFPVSYYAYTNIAMLHPFNSIVFNDALLQSLGSVRAQYKTDEWRGMHPAVPRNDEMYALALHELAHVLTGNLRLHNDVEIIRLYQLFQNDVASFIPLGSNAKLNVLEFVSACFVDAVCNGAKAQGISKAVLKCIEKRN